MFRGHEWQPRAGVTPAVLCAVERRQPPRPGVSRCVHEAWALDYEWANGLRYRVGSTRQCWRPRRTDALHIYPPGTVYWEDERAATTTSVRSMFLLLRGGEHTTLRHLLRDAPGVAVVEDPRGRLGALLERMVTVGDAHGDAGFEQAQALWWRMAAALAEAQRHRCGRFTLRDEPPATATPGLVARLDRYMRRNLAQRITLHDLARHARVSRSTVSHAYRAGAGRTPMAALARLRVEAAKPLILRRLPLREVAAQTGFSDGFHLSRTFTRIEGCSPKCFRQRGAAPDRPL